MSDRLLLAYLLPVAEKGVAESKLMKELEPYFARATTSRDAKEALQRVIDEQVEKGRVLRETVRKKAQVRLTAEGLRAAEALYPYAKRTTWANLKKTWLVAHALGLEASVEPSQVKQFSSVTALRMILINQHLELGLPVVPNVQAFDIALAWEGMRRGLSEAVYQWGKGRGLTQGAILGAQAASLGGVTPSTTKSEVYARLAAKVTGARNAGDLIPAIISRLAARDTSVDAHRARETTNAPEESNQPEGEATEVSPSEFATKLLDAARRSPTGKLDASLILINHAYAKYLEENPEDGMTLATFKDRLWSAALAGALTLASADMPQTLNSEDYRASRIDRGASTYALLRI